MHRGATPCVSTLRLFEAHLRRVVGLQFWGAKSTSPRIRPFSKINSNCARLSTSKVRSPGDSGADEPQTEAAAKEETRANGHVREGVGSGLKDDATVSIAQSSPKAGLKLDSSSRSDEAFDPKTPADAEEVANTDAASIINEHLKLLVEASKQTQNDHRMQFLDSRPNSAAAEAKPKNSRHENRSKKSGKVPDWRPSDPVEVYAGVTRPSLAGVADTKWEALDSDLRELLYMSVPNGQPPFPPKFTYVLTAWYRNGRLDDGSKLLQMSEEDFMIRVKVLSYIRHRDPSVSLSHAGALLKMMRKRGMQSAKAIMYFMDILARGGMPQRLGVLLRELETRNAPTVFVDAGHCYLAAGLALSGDLPAAIKTFERRGIPKNQILPLTHWAFIKAYARAGMRDDLNMHHEHLMKIRGPTEELRKLRRDANFEIIKFLVLRHPGDLYAIALAITNVVTRHNTEPGFPTSVWEALKLLARGGSEYTKFAHKFWQRFARIASTRPAREAGLTLGAETRDPALAWQSIIHLIPRKDNPPSWPDCKNLAIAQGQIHKLDDALAMLESAGVPFDAATGLIMLRGYSSLLDIQSAKVIFEAMEVRRWTDRPVYDLMAGIYSRIGMVDASRALTEQAATRGLHPGTHPQVDFAPLWAGLRQRARASVEQQESGPFRGPLS
ncbi:uncharacterized protein EV422DRAFT_567213 [Fimicolochytrium jonesii]|uniref:uncharacterized protein n=1 Tax=Fimicolochytrium jonesii TaxID=1396493 RepID=UPI0022FEA64E|nr:uncharacterized protein EV422DRAFT_567213 [Fimicolochytrium jonesii]KAI8821477.1 hypothetical protein EV422DRAFT_567213 [Fimicolochytrium jonesii]